MACPDCDAVQRLPPAGRAGCFRCGAVLVANDPPRRRSDSALALTLAAIPLFVAAIACPLVSLRGLEGRVDATVLALVDALLDQRMPLLALLVLLVIIALPAFQLASAAYLLAGARAGRAPAGTARLLRIRDVIAPWAQIEILLVGMLVAFGKLASIFPVVPGAGVVCMLAFLGLQRAARDALEPRHFWSGLS